MAKPAPHTRFLTLPFFVDVDPDANAILARPVFDVESAAAHAQCGVRADHEDRTRLRSTAIGRSRTLSDFMAAHASLEIAHGVDGDWKARAYPRTAQLLDERREDARPSRHRPSTRRPPSFRPWLCARRSPPPRTDHKRCASP